MKNVGQDGSRCGIAGRLLFGHGFDPSDLMGIVSRRVWRFRKEIRVRVLDLQVDRRIIVSILGCQRAGTRMLTRIFERDRDAKVYGEFSRLSSHDKYGLRLNDLNWVAQTLQNIPFPLIVLKPLVESQRAIELLNRLADSKVVWLYRDYRDVAASDLRKFGLSNGIRNLQPIVRRQRDNWRAERVSPDALNLVDKFYSEVMNPYDAAALFWLVRNALYFDQSLETHPRALLVKYEDLVTDALPVVQRIYAFLGRPGPDRRAVRFVNVESLSKGRQIKLSAGVADACDRMVKSLDESYQRQNLARYPMLAQAVERI